MKSACFFRFIAQNTMSAARCGVFRRGALFYRVVRRADRAVRRFSTRCGVSVAWCGVLSRGAAFYCSVRDFSSWCGVL